jgi:hypothetical protein
MLCRFQEAQRGRITSLILAADGLAGRHADGWPDRTPTDWPDRTPTDWPRAGSARSSVAADSWPDRTPTEWPGAGSARSVQRGRNRRGRPSLCEPRSSGLRARHGYLFVVLAFGFGDWHGVVVAPFAVDDSAADRVASLAPVPVAAFAPVEDGLSLGSAASGVLAEPPLDGVVLLAGVELGVGDGDVEVDDVMLVGLGDGVELVDWNGGAVEGCPDLYGVSLGLGLHVDVLLGELDTEGYGDWVP